jgi:hypothetical protein
VTTETPVRAPFIDGDPLTLRIQLGACRLRLAPGGDEPWVVGTYTDPTDDNPVRLEVGDRRLTIDQQRSVGGTLGLFKGAPTCELRLGTARPTAWSWSPAAATSTSTSAGSRCSVSTSRPAPGSCGSVPTGRTRSRPTT